jgi:hypothetical protein
MSQTGVANLDAGRKAIAVTRILTGIIFLFFGEYKIAGPEFAHTSFSVWVRGWLSQNEPVGFYVSSEVCAGASGAVREDCGLGRAGDWDRAGAGAFRARGIGRRRDSHDQFGAGYVVRAGAWRRHVEIFRRESGSYSAAIFICDFLRDARGRDVGD